MSGSEPGSARRPAYDPANSPYQGYVYAYPHKTAYRPLPEPVPLRQAWAGEDLSRLFLYAHVPFCEMRCGFCNLFTRTGAPEELVTAYLDAFERQARVVADAVPGARFVTGAVGGGTPTYLTARELERLFTVLTGVMGAELPGIPLSVETSPATATPDRLKVLAAYGATRVSIGVQSFIDAEARAAGRPQRRADVERALAAIRDAGAPVLNIDLIYGIDGQDGRSWRASLDAALAWAPEEMYLYPLYVRPLTGLGRRAVTRADWDEQRLTLYRAGREHLLAAGYEQVSMRMFRLPGTGAGTGTSGAGASGTGGSGAGTPVTGATGSAGPGTHGTGPAGPGVAGPSDYRCQSDGMVGLGCGARSYTSRLHHSFDYAVGVGHVRAILDEYVAMDEADFASARAGFVMDDAERRRRHLVTSVLQAEGLDEALYRERFGSHAREDFAAELAPLVGRGLLAVTPGRIAPTEEGLAWSDAIGPALFSDRVRALMNAYEAR